MTTRTPSLLGQRFGKLVVVERTPNKGRASCWRCLCDCGNTTITEGRRLSAGRVKSCGCLRAENLRGIATTHGLSTSPLHGSWAAMTGRCYDPANNRYARYGGRGIRVCRRWQHLENFVADMAASYFDGATIERNDNDGDYEPGNCRWATNAEQARNKSTTVLVQDMVDEARRLYVTTRLTQQEIGKRLGVSRDTIKHCLRRLRR